MENWKVHPVFKRYSVSSLGKVMGINSKILTPYKFKSKKSDVTYCQFSLRHNGKTVKKFAHSLVLEAFVSSRPKGLECRHLNGDPLDNRLNNLKWGTQRENLEDKYLHGKVNSGECIYNSKSTNEEAFVIKHLHKNSVPNFLIARIMNKPERYIANVARKERYKHLVVISNAIITKENKHER